MRGQGGSDDLYGESGTDVLWGGAGDDELWGGTGKDVHQGRVKKQHQGEAASNLHARVVCDPDPPARASQAGEPGQRNEYAAEREQDELHRILQVQAGAEHAHCLEV
nr:calcium-binding protein [Rubellimicrobium mesophilum]